ncbi:hypothetical protein [Myxococcus vastator]|uniref:hypothetical protein n=1 Tax=Myxococcus vastator TaxID=2709664 RepID=UPI0013D3BF3A|nr:hypothetical protein [Myxococcus vastator]
MAKNYETVTIRMLTYEHDCFKSGVAALKAHDPSLTYAPVFYTAGLEEAHRLGVYTGSQPSTPLKAGGWKNEPKRPEGISTRERVTITVHPTHFDVIGTAAAYVHVSVPIFLIGSGFRYLANLKLANARFETAALEAERARFNPGLKALRLPRQYEPFPADFDGSDPDWV